MNLRNRKELIVKKEKLRSKVGTWCKDHVVEIGIGTTFVLGGVAGFILGKDIGKATVLNDFKEVIPDIEWMGARVGSAATLYTIEQKIPEADKLIMDYAEDHIEEIRKMTSDKIREILFK